MTALTPEWPRQLLARLLAEEVAPVGQPAPDPARPARQRPGHLLDVLGEIGAARVTRDDQLTDREDGTGPGAMVPSRLLRAVRDGRAFHAALPGAEPTWALLAAATLAEACVEWQPDQLRPELLQHAAVILAWLQAIDTRQEEA